MRRARPPCRFPALALLAGASACEDPEAACAAGFERTGEERCEPPPPGTFAGIESATWNGADGLEVSWGSLQSGDPSTFTLSVERDAVVNTHGGLTGTHALVEGLEDGEYLLTVTVDDDGDDPRGADRTLTQLVGENRLVYRSEVPTRGGARTIAGDGDLVVTGGGLDEGVVTLFDIADVLAVETLAELDGLSNATDVDLSDGRIAVALDTTMYPDEPYSAYLYDASDPTEPVAAGAIPSGTDNAHTLSFGGNYLYLASTQNSTVAVFDVSDLDAPERVGAINPPPPARVHDQTVVGSTLYSAYGEGLAVYDVSDPTSAVVLAAYVAGWENAFVHNVWPTADGATLAVSEEAVGGSLHIFDASRSGALELVTTVQVHPEHSIHNVMVRDRYAFCGWFVEGVLVFDLATPSEPALVGWYDTWNGGEEVEVREDGSLYPNVNGASQVWANGPHIAAADTSRGLVLFDFFPVTRTWGDGWVE